MLRWCLRRTRLLGRLREVKGRRARIYGRVRMGRRRRSVRWSPGVHNVGRRAMRSRLCRSYVKSRPGMRRRASRAASSVLLRSGQIGDMEAPGCEWQEAMMQNKGAGCDSLHDIRKCGGPEGGSRTIGSRGPEVSCCCGGLGLGRFRIGPSTVDLVQ